jgi:hypothetical protein
LQQGPTQRFLAVHGDIASQFGLERHNTKPVIQCSQEGWLAPLTFNMRGVSELSTTQTNGALHPSFAVRLLEVCARFCSVV